MIDSSVLKCTDIVDISQFSTILENSNFYYLIALCLSASVCIFLALNYFSCNK